MKTHVTPTALPGVVIVTIDAFRDERGFFVESWHKRHFAEAGLDLEFVQEGHSRSGRNILRGLHYQDSSAPMGKLLRCTVGAIFDVAVDIRSASPACGQWVGVELSAENMTQIYVPPGFAHGFVTLSDVAEVQYKQTGFYTPQAEGSIRWDDPALSISWPAGVPVLSVRDHNAQSFAEYLKKPAF
jgi:dTDP-4-dehydrorhamnose 3,5-epimerase